MYLFTLPPSLKIRTNLEKSWSKNPKSYLTDSYNCWSGRDRERFHDLRRPLPNSSWQNGSENTIDDRNTRYPFFPKAFIWTGCFSQKITLIYHSHLKQSDLQNEFQQFYKLSAKRSWVFNCFLKVCKSLEVDTKFYNSSELLTFNIKVESSKSFTIFCWNGI